MVQQYDVMVAGGGVVGLSAALGLAQRGLTVALVDARDLEVTMPEPGGRLYALNHASRQLLEGLGAWSFIDRQHISSCRAMHVWDAASSACIDFDARMLAQDRLVDFIDEQVLRHALLQAIHANGSLVLFPHQRVSKIQEITSGIAIDAQDTLIEAKGLVIADGAQSPCRELLQIPQKAWSYHQQALVATVSCEKPHQKTARQVFTASGSLALLPMSDEMRCSIVWSLQEQEAARLLQMPAEAFNDLLTTTFERKLGAIQVVNTPQSFPLMMRHTTQYTGRFFVVLGDAAHTIHPLAGLGLNLGLKDVRDWLACFDRVPGCTWPLKKDRAAFERRRKADVWQSIVCMQGLKDLFLNSLPLVKHLRGFGLRTANQMLSLKRWLIAEAMDGQRDDIL